MCKLTCTSDRHALDECWTMLDESLVQNQPVSYVALYVTSVMTRGVRAPHKGAVEGYGAFFQCGAVSEMRLVTNYLLQEGK